MVDWFHTHTHRCGGGGMKTHSLAWIGVSVMMTDLDVARSGEDTMSLVCV